MLILTRVPVHLSGSEERPLSAVVALYSEHIIKMSASWNDKCLLFSAFHVSQLFNLLPRLILQDADVILLGGKS
jgi:hypothetical protein